MDPTKMLELVNQDDRNNTSFQVENSIKQQYPLYNLFIEFPTAPKISVPAGKGDIFTAVMFPAYLSSAITDSYTPSYADAGTVFGRMDPIPVYSRTTRSIKVEFNIPAFDIDDARQIRAKLDIVVKNTYPTYKKGNSSLIERLTVFKPPLIRIKFGNIICSPIDQFKGLLGYLSNGITISHDLSSGVFTTWPGQEIYAKKYSLTLNMNVLHEFTPGFVDNGDGNLATGNNFLRTNTSMIFPGTNIRSKTEAEAINNGSSTDYNIAGVDSQRRKLIESKLGLK